jgi:hypothetical protein
MLTLEQRRRHNKRITKAFGEGRISWHNDKATIKPRKGFGDVTCRVHHTGVRWVLKCDALDMHIKDQSLTALANQLKLAVLLGG